MAILVPDLNEINRFVPPLTEGERALMNALCAILDDNWTIYVQSYLNGLRPDIVIFCEDAGVGIFEVKDWIFEVNQENQWKIRAKDTGDWIKANCPFQQVNKYKQSIMKREIPILYTKQILDFKVKYLITTFVYFHKYKTEDIKKEFKPIETQVNQYKYKYFGYDDLHPEKLKQILNKHYLKHGSKFTGLMTEIGLADRLANALAYPRHGNTNLENFLQPLTSKQKELLSNNSGTRRVKGAAGSGKTFLLVHKAVNAAREKKRVLLVCYNITMVNYLRDLVVCLARHYDRKCLEYIEIGHFHRLFPLENNELDRRNVKEKIDVLLIDEGQDFQRSWVEILQSICNHNYHLFFCEDRRQNIYGTESMPLGAGRPNELKQSFRIPTKTAQLANYLYDWANIDGKEEKVEGKNSVQTDLFVKNIWFNGNQKECLNYIQKDIGNLIKDRNTARADIAILVCTVEDGWQVCDVLKTLSLPYQKNFESKEEFCQLKQISQKEGWDKNKFKDNLRVLRKGYKVEFWMQGGMIKVCTIHSFKGWELSNILILFNPDQEQEETKYQLLYTAITRSQQNLTVYNMVNSLNQFSEEAIEKGYIEKHSKELIEETNFLSQSNNTYYSILSEFSSEDLLQMEMDAYGYDPDDFDGSFEDYLESFGYD